MIRKALKKEHNILTSFISDHRYENVYLYIDILTYGFQNENINTYVLENDKELFAVIYEYYNSFQVLEIERPTVELVEEIARFISDKNIIRISGSYSLLLRIFQTYDKKYLFTPGNIMKYQFDKSYKVSSQSCFASYDELDEIATLIVNDQHLGKSYTFSSLCAQLKSRFINNSCKSLCIKKNGIIISHFASFAVTDDIVVLSGMITRPEFRGKGYGSIVVKDLSQIISKTGKTPILYCYEEEYNTWYQKLGYMTIENCAKLEKI